MTSLGPPPPGMESVARLSLPQLCGQLLVVGFDGPSVPDRLRAHLEAGLRGGVILFARNLTDPSGAWELCRQVLELTPSEIPPLLGVDQEGGRVRRFGAPVLRLPSARSLGATNAPELVYRAASLLARQLGAIGLSCDFAPVLDVDTRPDSPVIGDRSFSGDPLKVAQFGLAFAKGLQDQGLMACGKHFPGHGDTELDSHVAVPVVKHDWDRLSRIELLPFREAAAARVAGFMTAHVSFPSLDASGVVATLSSSICTTLLRQQLGFEGVLFSDDLEMRAVLGDRRIEDVAVEAVRAGCDALLVCHDPDRADAALDALVASAEQDPDLSMRILDAAYRFIAARRRFRPRPALTLGDLHGVVAETEETVALLAELQRTPTRT